MPVIEQDSSEDNTGLDLSEVAGPMHCIARTRERSHNDPRAVEGGSSKIHPPNPTSNQTFSEHRH